MTNRRYVAGRNYEYRVANKLRKEGWLVIRSAGSHSIFDLVAVRVAYGSPLAIVKDAEIAGTLKLNIPPYGAALGQIKLIQCKTGKSAKRAIKAVEQSDIKRWNGLYSVSVEVI